MRIVKLVLIAIGALFALCVVASLVGARNRADAQSNARAAAAKKGAEDKAKFDRAFAGNLNADQLVATCVDASKSGGVPASEKVRCADAVLAAARSALAAKRPTDALPLFEAVAKVSTKPEEAQAGIAEAKAMVAIESATNYLTRAETAWAAGEFGKALTVVGAAKRTVDDGLKAKPDDSALRSLAERIAPLHARADEWRLAGEVVKLAGGELPYEYSSGALVVQAVNHTEGEFKDILVSGHIPLKMMAREGFEKMSALQSITLVESHTFTDSRGNEAGPKKVAELKVTRKNASTIGWDDITPQNLFKVLDKKWVAPGVHIEDAL